MNHEKNIAISLKNVSKTFRIREGGSDTIRERVRSVFNKDSIRELEALSDISFDVYKGDFFGIIGHNGSGKSTLLKIIIGAIKPDQGSEILTRGKVLRLALGMGFDLNLSARDNVYVNGSIMGLTFRNIGEVFHEIIAFAELENFIDTPIKYYSSGMVSRLAFAISVYVDTEILLIDEFFGGVGDESFKLKSSEVFKKRIIEGKTVVFVSHDMQTIKKYCNRVCVLNKGRMIACGAPSEIVDSYIQSYQQI